MSDSFSRRRWTEVFPVTPATLLSLPKWTVIPTLDTPGPRLVETRALAGKGALP